MKTNLNGNKGITLIALIITIIVLLILAVVTISAVNEGNIFAHANNAATKWNAAATEENKILSNYLTEMEKHDGGTKTTVNPGEGGNSEISENGPTTLDQIKNAVYQSDKFRQIINDDFSVSSYTKNGEEWTRAEFLDYTEIIYLGYGKISEVDNEDFEEVILDESFSNTDFSLNDNYHIFVSYYDYGTYSDTCRFLYAISNATEVEKSKMFWMPVWLKDKLCNIQTLEYINVDD